MATTIGHIKISSHNYPLMGLDIWRRRHSWKGVDRSLIDVKELLNHGNISTTAIYSHIDAGARRAAVEDLAL